MTTHRLAGSRWNPAISFASGVVAEGLGLWLDADVLYQKPFGVDSASLLSPRRSGVGSGNSVLYMPPDDPIIAGRSRALIRPGQS